MFGLWLFFLQTVFWSTSVEQRPIPADRSITERHAYIRCHILQPEVGRCTVEDSETTYRHAAFFLSCYIFFRHGSYKLQSFIFLCFCDHKIKRSDWSGHEVFSVTFQNRVHFPGGRYSKLIQVSFLFSSASSALLHNKPR